MRPIKFKDANCTFAEHQEEYLPLPAHRDCQGIITSCWAMSFKERIKVLLSGKIFVQSMTFDKPLQPLNVLTEFKP